MNHFEVEAFVKKITYKPGWKITYRWDSKLGSDSLMWDQGEIWVTAEVEDTYNPGRTIDFFTRDTLYLHYFDNEEGLREYIYRLVQRAEMHETAEWFRVDGVMVYDPHK